MKVFATVLAVIIASSSALPQLDSDERTVLSSRDQRLVTDAIASAIEDVSMAIREAGLDPLNIEREDLEYALPVPSIFTMSAHADDVRSNGLSNIVINNLNFGLITTRLTFDIALPRIDLSMGSVAAEAHLFGRKLDGFGSGRFAVNNIRIRGNVRVSVGIISGISIRDLTLNFSLGGIESNLNVEIFGTNISQRLNTFLGQTIPETLHEYRADINELLEIVVREILDEVL